MAKLLGRPPLPSEKDFLNLPNRIESAAVLGPHAAVGMPRGFRKSSMPL